MNLYNEILIRISENKNVKVEFTNSDEDVSKITVPECYNALEKIKAAIEDDSLEDKECLDLIVEIVADFERVGD